jgi:hypothetical protein
LGISDADEKQPERATIFLDRDLGSDIVADWLRNIGTCVEVHRQHFEPDTPDELWVPKCAEYNWITTVRL